MQSVALTEEHKIKLLEMCKTLFSEYDYFKLEEDNVCGLTQQLIDFENRDWFDNHNESEKWNIENYENWEFTIHWFEFCFRYLVSAIQDKMSDELAWREMPPYVENVYRWKKGDKWTLYTEFLFHYPKACFGCSNLPINPIDYLYNEFLKLK